MIDLLKNLMDSGFQVAFVIDKSEYKVFVLAGDGYRVETVQASEFEEEHLTKLLTDMAKELDR